ncbi:MAG: hypothetical protein IJV84_01425 [Bacteroidales bacterium]|nr:hypothetical protein [Bacteroidales bacterium]MBQ9722163.1 hypothetical protein [Bacteroidales bacterium]
MRDLLHKLLKSLNFSRRDGAVLLLALLLAFSIWLIHNLSLRYSDYMSVPVVARCNIDGHTAESIDKCDVAARCRATGYNILANGIRKNGRAKKIEFSPSLMKQKDEDLYYLLPSDLQEYTHLIYGDEVTVEYFVSDTLFFRFPYEDNKRVPLQLVTSISFHPQFMMVGDIEVSPDSVTVYGERYKLESIDRVYTSPVKVYDLSEDLIGVVDIEKIRGVRMSASEAHFAMDVSRYVELVHTFPVTVVNVPADKRLNTYPASVTATFRCAFPMVKDPAESVSFYVDYDDFATSRNGKCPVYMTQKPKGLITYEIQPSMLECVLEDKL